MDATTEMANIPRQLEGCPTCWHSSKEWAVAKVFGTQNTFDVVARDGNGETLAVEVKWLPLTGGKGPNGPFQRFIGQCVIAGSVHGAVIGVCCFRGTLKPNLTEHQSELQKHLKAIGVTIVDLYAADAASE